MNPETTQDSIPYRLVTMNEFINMELPQREWLLYPFLQERSTCMLHAKRGVGKTYVGLSMALAVAGGVSIMGFNANRAHKVLYIDGEMAAYDLRERVRALALGLGDRFSGIDNLSFLAADLQTNGGINLARQDTQEKINSILDEFDLIVIDNLSALYNHGKENEAESWTPMQNWLLSLKRRGKCVLVIDHSGKNDTNRGTSKKQDMLESIICLTHPEGYKESDGAHFVLSYTKSRGVCGTDIGNKEIWLCTGEDTESLFWSVTDYTSPKDRESAAQRERARELRAKGMSVREIAEAMGCGKTKAAELVRGYNPSDPSSA